MNLPLFVIPAFVDKIHVMNTLLDDGCQSYGFITQSAVLRAKLPRVKLEKRILPSGWTGNEGDPITEAAIIHSLDVGGSLQKQDRVFLYIVPTLGEYDMILGKPWRKHERAYVDEDTGTLHIRRTDTIVKLLDNSQPDIAAVSAVSFNHLSKRPGTSVFKVTMADIEKALAKLEMKPVDFMSMLPARYHEFAKVFDPKEAEKLPIRRSGIDHRIELLKDEKGQDLEAPWGPLYAMSREQLLVLRKTLTDQLEKGFIRVSNSPAAAPVLFVKKPGGGLRFCVDYRGLNDVTKKDRYPLPLIKETLHQIGKAKYFTKLDIIAAFNKIRVAEGDEWKTAFRTRYGLFEYLVMPFGLANAPSTFQRYVNYVLREFLDTFVSAYVDDILIYTDGPEAEHEAHVRKVLTKLQEAGLQVDIAKCEFHVPSTRYLGYIIEAGRGIRMDPGKVQAILDWEVPTSVKGVRSFIGFANFYHTFIKDFASLVTPLTQLTTKEMSKRPFKITPEAEDAFHRLKKAFVTAPVIAQFDPDLETILESDASGWCSGGVLKQKHGEVERPIAFFSKRHTPAECNYEIHDKELLSIMKCLEEWDQFLIAVPRFTIRTDHKNLEYFQRTQKLSERQVRWSLTLSRFNFVLEYHPGKLNVTADALSRRDQDIPADDHDARITSREIQLLPGHVFPVPPESVQLAPVQVDPTPDLPNELDALWQEHEQLDPQILDLKAAVSRGDRSAPSHLRHLGLQMLDLALHEGHLTYRRRYWVPNHEPLRTRLIQEHHDSSLTNHPGKGNLIAILARMFHWPGMSKQVGQFTAACGGCGRNTVWRSRRQGLLQPLPVPDRVWSEISMDYITDLPITKQGNRHILTIVDRLSKGVITVPCKDLDGETLARKIWRHYCSHHGLPSAITSDRGEQFVHGIWGHMARMYGIKKRLSTAYAPTTDGQTERAHQTIEETLRLHCSYHQDNWDNFLPHAQIAILNREASATRMSPFFLTHGYHPNLGVGIHLPDLSQASSATNPADAAARIIQKINDAIEFAQASMQWAQQNAERIANRRRDPATAYRPGDKVWLDLRNIRVENPRKKKLCELHGMFKVLENVGSSAYKLDTPPGIHNVFSTSLLRPVLEPLPSQIVDDTAPPPIFVDNEEEYEIEQIENHRFKLRRGNNSPGRLEFLCKWKGYARPSWTNSWNCANCVALDHYEAQINRKFTAEELGIDD